MATAENITFLSSATTCSLEEPRVLAAAPTDDTVPTAERTTKTRRLLTTAAPSLEPTPEDQQALFTVLLAMVQKFLELETILAKTKSTEISGLAEISAKIEKSVQENDQKELSKLEDQLAEAEKAKTANFWMRIGAYVLSAVAVVTSVFTAGIVTGMVIASLTALQQTGVTEKMFDGIDNSTARYFAKVGFSIGVSLAGAGAAGLFDGAVGCAAQTAAVQGAAEISANSAAQAGSGAVANALAGNAAIQGEAADAAGTLAMSEFFCSTFKASWDNIMTQALFSSGFITDTAKDGASGLSKLCGGGELVFNIALVFALTGSMMSGGNPLGSGALTAMAKWGAPTSTFAEAGTGSLLMEALNRGAAQSRGAESFKGFLSFHNAMSKVCSSKTVLGLMVSTALFSNAWTIRQGIAQREMGNISRDQGDIQALIQTLLQLAQRTNSLVDTTSEREKQDMESLVATVDPRTLTQEAAWAAQVLA